MGGTIRARHAQYTVSDGGSGACHARGEVRPGPGDGQKGPPRCEVARGRGPCGMARLAASGPPAPGTGRCARRARRRSRGGAGPPARDRGSPRRSCRPAPPPAAATIWSPGSPVQTRNDTSTPRSRPRATSACASRSRRSRTWSTRARNRPPGSSSDPGSITETASSGAPRLAARSSACVGRRRARLAEVRREQQPAASRAAGRARAADGRERGGHRHQDAGAAPRRSRRRRPLSGTTISTLTMPNIPSAPSTWGRMWQWNAHSPTRSAVDVDVPPLARADRDRVGAVRVGAQRVAVARPRPAGGTRGCGTGGT